MKSVKCLYCLVLGIGLLCSSISSTPVANSTEVVIQGVGVALCPRRHFCFVDNYYNDPDCGCDQRCLRVGACCVNYLQESNASLDQFLEMPSTCVNTASKEAFYLVNGCNDTWHDSSIKSMCEEQAGASDILRNLPVSDPNGVDYKNIYCSVCNYVEKDKAIAWEVILTCNQTLSNITTLKNIGDECLVEYKTRASMPIMCDHNVVGSCPDPSSEEDAHQCQTYSAEVKINGTTYKNPHCASCNNVEVRSLNCTDVADGDVQTFFSIETKSLSILFDFSISGNTQVRSSHYAVPEIQSSCERDEMYDPFEEKCVVVSCAKGMVYIDDECLPLTTEGTIHTCESSSLIIDYMTSENVFSGIECLKEKLDINEADFSNVSQCNEINCFHVNLQILDVNSSLPEHFKNLFDRTFLVEDMTGRMCSISSIDVVHLCHNVPRNTCYSTVNKHESKSPVNSFSGSYDIDWRYGFWYDTDRQIYNATSNIRTCRANYETNLTCPFVKYPANGFREYSSKGGHTSLVHNASGIIYGPTEYENLKNGSILVCPKYYPKSVDPVKINGTDFQSLLTAVGTGLSLAALFLTFICYCRFRALRTLPGKSVMNLVVALFFALLIFLLGSGQTQHVNLCTAVAVLQHFFWLASFFWMNILAFDVRQTFNFKSSSPNARRKRNTLIVYAVYAWGSPATIVGTCLALIYSPVELDMYYGNSDICYFGNRTMNLIAFGGPVALTLSLNAIFFTMTVVSIRKTKQVTKVVQKNKTTTKSRLEELLIYAKLSTLMGMSWIIGFVANFANSDVVWYIFIVLNSLQGVFVFIFFVCNRRVYKLIRKGKAGTPSSKTRSTDVKSGRSDCSEVKEDEHKLKVVATQCGIKTQVC